MTIDASNQPQWKGQSGFFEIWFLVIFIPGQKRAIWLRYSLFSPAPGQPGQPRSVLWAAIFNANASEPSLALKRILPIDAYTPRTDGSFGIRIGDGEFATGVCRGTIQDQGNSIAWDFQFDPNADEIDRSSIVMSHHLPLPTRVIHAHEGAKFRGSYSIDGTTFSIQDAPGLQKHLWGEKRLEELFWIYCSQFQQDPSARVEATGVRPSRTLVGHVAFPSLAPIWYESSSETYDFYSAWRLIRNVVQFPAPGKLQFSASSLLQSIEIDAHCDLNALVGYIYRDPKGTDLYVAQCDIANCEVRLFERSHPFTSFRQTRTLTSTNGAAIEFHLPEPLLGVPYIGWDETSLAKR
jgi:hypothetical protein